MTNSTAVTECTTNSCEAFDSRINNWAEGVLLTIDADHSKLTIRGSDRPYASEYAKMLKAIHAVTDKMTQSERAKRTLEMRLEWKIALEKANTTESAKDRDMSFSLPGKDGKLVVVDETPFYNREAHGTTSAVATASLTDKECKAVHELKNLKVGERVVIGYNSGILKHDAYAVIKANTCSSK